MTIVPIDDVNRRKEIALKLAPSLRDKFDFSRPEQYDDWASMAFVAADAFIKKVDAILMAATAKEEAKSLAAKHEAEMAKMVKKEAK